MDGGILAWQNLVFVIPMGVGIILALGLAFGLGGDHDVDHDVGDHDHDVHKEVGKETGKETGKGAKDPLHATGEELGFHPISSFLDLMGFGRVPFTVLAVTLCMTWGVVGFISNALLAPAFHVPAAYAPISMGAAFVGMVLFTGRIARLLNRYGPTNESYVRPPHDLAGRVGEIVSDCDAGRGYVLVTDGNNLKQQVPCRSNVAIPSGKQVLITEYLEDQDMYLVEEYRDDVPPAA